MKRASASKSANCPIGIEKDFLHKIFGVVMVAAVAKRQGIHHPPVIGHQ
jgi:hypothetical protein